MAGGNGTRVDHAPFVIVVIILLSIFWVPDDIFSNQKIPIWVNSGGS
jgi:hypothetical protein